MDNHTYYDQLDLTEAERATNFETMLHIINVQTWLRRVREDLDDRGAIHDRSKMEPPEVATFTRITGGLRGLDYGSEEYKAVLRDPKNKPAIQHHQQFNTHHPECYEDGIDGMSLLDLIELVCDWKAATLRHGSGDMRKSIEINAERFGMSEQLVAILHNTVDWMEVVEQE